MLARLAAIFPGRLYVELQRHGLPVEAAIEPLLIDLAYDLDLPLVSTNEAFFPTAADSEAHDALLCLAQGAHIGQDDRRPLTPRPAFKRAAPMRPPFAPVPDAVDNPMAVPR